MNIRHVLKLLVITVAVFFAGFLIEEFIEQFPAFTISARQIIVTIEEIFPILMEFSIFAMVWFSYDRSKNNHSLFMGMAFLMIGLIDLLHTLSYPYMPNLITPNSMQKAAFFHSEARLISGILFLVSAYIYRDTLPKLINKSVLLTFVIILFLISLILPIFYLDRLPILYSDRTTPTALIIRQFISSSLILYASYLYIKRYQRTGERYILSLIYGFIIIIFSDLIYYTYQLPGHLLRVAAYFFMYLALYRSSVELPYEKLAAAEERLRQAAEEKYRSLVQTANDAIISEDSNGTIVSWNRGAQAIFGYEEKEVLGKSLTILMPERYKDDHRKGFERLRATGKSEYIGKTHEFYGLRKNGTEFPLELSITAWKTEEGIFYTGIIRDITERKRAEEALHKAYAESELRVQERTAELAKTNESLKTEIAQHKHTEEKLRISINQLNAILTNIPDIAWLKDKESRFIAVNKPFADTAGVTPEYLIGKTDFDIWPKELAESYRADDREVMATGKRKQVVEPLVDKEGKKTWIETIKTPIYDDRGNVIGTIGIAHDVTERKRMEEEREKWTAELARSNAELEQFAYIASHDLQEPLRMVSGFTQLLARRYKDRLDKDANEFIGYIVDGTTRMQRMIEDLLAYSRVGTRGKPFETTDLEGILNQAMTNLKASIEQNGAVVTHDTLPTVMADPTQMVQVFQNLIGNAIKFRKQDKPPHIHIGAQRKGDEWIFSVQDNGIGMAPEFMGHLFQLFQREHGAGEYPGTGIGLAICKRIIERHGGRIWAESEPRKGSTFYFTIPVKK